MFHLAQPISAYEKFRCEVSDCRCKLTQSPKKSKTVKDDAIQMAWEEVDPSVVEAPLNFAQVDSDLYRSSFPKPGNYRFLETLNLRTIICLVEDEPLPAQYVDWTQRLDIQLIQIGMPGHKEAFRDGIPYELVGEALRLVVNQAKYPLLIHCNRGKHRTGTVVACFRKLRGWHTTRAMDEYVRFSHPKERETDTEFISAFDVNELRSHVTRSRLKSIRAEQQQQPASPFSSILNLAKA